jgi:elongation factor P
MHVNVLFFNGKAVEVDAAHLRRKADHRDRARLQGQHRHQHLQAAKVDTGYEIQVPLFIDQGEWVRIDTRTGEYSERITKNGNF